MNEQANIALVKQGYDAYSKGDIQRLLGLFAQDIEWELPEIEGIAFTGTRRGIDQVAEFFRLMDESQETREFTPDEYFAQGDRVVVLGHGSFSVRATGIDYSDEWSHAFTVVNGKVSAFREYSDTLKAAQAYRLQAAIAGAPAGVAAGRGAVH